MLLLPTTTLPNERPVGTADMPFPLVEFDPDDPPEDDPPEDDPPEDDPPEDELPVGAPDFTLAQPPSVTRAIQEISKSPTSLLMRFPAVVA